MSLLEQNMTVVPRTFISWPRKFRAFLVFSQFFGFLIKQKAGFFGFAKNPKEPSLSFSE